MSEKGPSNLIPHIISILHCILDYVDVTSIPPISINNDLNKIISKYVDGTQYKDSLKILKHIVTRSSTLAAPPAYSSINTSSSNSTIMNSGMGSVSSSINYPSITDSLILAGAPFSDSTSKLELPGRTIEFSIDVNQTPIVGRKFIDKKENIKDENSNNDKKLSKEDDSTLSSNKTSTKTTTTASNTTTNEPAACSPRRSLSYTHSFNENSSNWKRPWACQTRVRDKLISLLTSFGQRVGLPKSPSCIFSQNSDIIDRQSSLASSTEEVSISNNEISSDSKIEENPDRMVFKEFDFLEYELGGQEEESMDNFNWAGLRRPIEQNDQQQQDLDLETTRLSSPSPANSLMPHHLRNQNKDTDLSNLSSDEEESVSPLFNSINYNNELVQELSP